MNTLNMGWTMLMLALTVLLIALPFWPAWAEWRQPRDQEPWPLPSSLLQSDVQGQPVLRQRLRVPSGASFGQLQARQIEFGRGVPEAARSLPALQRWQAPQGARAWGPKGWHWPRGMQIPPAQHVTGSLVVQGPLEIGDHCLIEGDVKAHGKLKLGAHSRVLGNVFCEGDMTLGNGSRVVGLVMAEGRLHLSPGVVIGSPQQPVSTCADCIDIQGPVRIHGTVHARLQGHVARNRPSDRPSLQPLSQENTA